MSRIEQQIVDAIILDVQAVLKDHTLELGTLLEQQFVELGSDCFINGYNCGKNAMNETQDDNICDRYCFNIFTIDDTIKFGFQIGYKNSNHEIALLCTKGSYDNEKEAEIAATAFIAGINFFPEVSQ